MKNDSDIPRERVGDRVAIVQRGKSGIYSAEFHYAGRHCRRSLKTKNRKVARQRAKKLDEDLEAGDVRQVPKAIVIPKAIDRYVDHKDMERRTKKTCTKYRTELYSFSAFAGEHAVRTLQQITIGLHDLYRAKRKKELQDSTEYTHAVILKGFLDWCVVRELLMKNPLAQFVPRKPPRNPAASPTIAQVWQLIHGADGELAGQIALLAFSGMRSGEMQHLRMEDVDLVEGWIHIRSRESWSTKTGASRSVPIHECIRPYLESQPKRHRPWFYCAAPSGRYPRGDHHINIKHLNERFQRVAESLSLPVGRKNGGFVVHSLRHFFRSFCTNKGIPERVIDLWQGHVGTRTTGAIYYHLTAAESQEFMRKVPFDETISNPDQRGSENEN